METVEQLFEDPHLIAVNKQAPRSTQAHETDSLAALLRDSRPGGEPLTLFGVHRIDIPVTGVVLYARTREAAAAMSALFAEGNVQKHYWAAVSAPPAGSEGVLDHYIVHNKRRNRSVCFDTFQKGARFCRTVYRVFGRSDRYWFIELQPETGRTHQLRAQMEAIGCPIKGDQKYGARRGNRNRLIHLHAHSLAFIHPVHGTEIRIRAWPPGDPVWNAALDCYREANGG